MPAIVIEPEEIQLNDWSLGWLPDLADAAVPKEGLIDSLNLLPDRDTGTLVTRKGYQRFSNLLVQDYEISAIHKFSTMVGTPGSPNQDDYLVCVLRKTPKPSPREASDVQIWLVDVQAATATRIDDATTRVWGAWPANHFGITANGTFFGGGEADPVYTYRPVFQDGTTNPDPYDPDGTMGQFTSSQWTVNTAYSVGDRVWDTVAVEKLDGTLKELKYVFVCTTAHTAKSWIRPGSEIKTDSDGNERSTDQGGRTDRKWELLGRHVPLWATGVTYKVGDKVSHLVSDNQSFPRGLNGAQVNKRSTFICIREHDSATGQNDPPGGPWQPLRAPVTNTAIYHGSRIIMKDGLVGSSILRYSEFIDSSSYFDPSDWQSTDVQGAGFFPVGPGDGDDMTAYASLDQYLIIAKKNSVWALSGLNPSTWSMRPISTDKGAFWRRSIVSHDGAVYFMGDQGLCMTDGAVVQDAPGNDYIVNWLRDNVDTETHDNHKIWKVTLNSFLGLIWCTFPPGNAHGSRTPLTLVYDPKAGTWWKTDMPAWQMVTTHHNRVDRMYFAKVGAPAMVMRYAPSTEPDRDDTGVTTQAFREIAWSARLAWITFSTAREQRRLRKVWALLKASSKTITLKLFRDYKTTAEYTVARSTTADKMNYVEGQAIRGIDPSAVSLEVSGNAAPANLLAVNILTQFRRRRYHR